MHLERIFRAEASSPVCEFIKMSKSQTLRALVNERLAAAAENIFVLFEKTIAEYEEELCRCKGKNQRKQQLLEKGPRIDLIRGNVQIPPTSPGPGLNQEITDTPRIKEEPEEENIKQEEEQLPELNRSPLVCEFVKMSKSQTLRALMTERLAAEAEDIFMLFERTIVEYEEELCRYKEENQRKQQLLENGLSSRVDLIRGNVQSQQIKEEPEEQEEEQLPESVPESTAVCVKTEESSLRHTVHSLHTDSDENWQRPISFSVAQMETEADGDHYNQVQIRDTGTKLFPQNKTAPETIVHSGHMSGTDGAEWSKHQCPFCKKKITTKQHLKIHMRIHTGEKPYSCSTCEKTFAQRNHLEKHKRTHTGEKPFSCLICRKTFAYKCNLDLHKRTHTGEKPYSCTVCKQRFADHSNLMNHTRTHTGERPYRCSTCTKTFARKEHLKRHMNTHRV